MSGEVPSGWKVATFNDVARVERGLTYSNKQECAADDPDAQCVLRIPNVQNQRFDEGDLKYINGVPKKSATKYRVEPGSILMVGSNGNADRVGNCCFVESSKRYLFASFLMRVVPSPNSVEPRFLYYLVAGGEVQSAITDAVAGTTGLKNISLEMLRAYSFALPPLPEQKKIAAILSSVDEAIQATQRVIDQTRRVKEGLLQDLLTRGMPGHTRFKQTEIGEIPESWEVVASDDFFERLRVPQTLDRNSKSETGTTPILDQSIEGWFGFHDGDADFPASLHDPLITFANHTCAVRYITTPFSVIQNVFPLRPADKVASRFLFWQLVSAIPQDGYRGHWPEVKRHKFLKPPLEEQERIVAQVDVVASVEMSETEKLNSLASLKAGLLQDLLTGKVRVSP